jgi:hypothetical protein
MSYGAYFLHPQDTAKVFSDFLMAAKPAYPFTPNGVFIYIRI